MSTLKPVYFPGVISNTRQVVIACAYSVPSGLTSFASAVASCRPQCRTVPMARTRCTFVVMAFTMFTPSSAVVYPRPTGIMVCTAQPRAESSNVAYWPP